MISNKQTNIHTTLHVLCELIEQTRGFVYYTQTEVCVMLAVFSASPHYLSKWIHKNNLWNCSETHTEIWYIAIYIHIYIYIYIYTHTHTHTHTHYIVKSKASNCVATVWAFIKLYSNMTVSLCIRQGSKINDDWVSVEELDWSAESQVLIPAEHLWCDFKCRPCAKN